MREIDQVVRCENAKNFTKKLRVETQFEFRNEIYPKLVYPSRLED